MPYARIHDGALVEEREDIPVTPLGQEPDDWRPLAIQYPEYDRATHQVGNPIDLIEADQVTRTWTVTTRARDAASVKAEVSRRILAGTKDDTTQRNMTALSVAILKKQIDGTATQEDLATLALLDAAFAWITATQAEGRRLIADAAATPAWPTPPAGLAALVAAL